MDDAKRLRTRLIQVFEAADANPARIDEGALNIVIVGAGSDRRRNRGRARRSRQRCAAQALSRPGCPSRAHLSGGSRTGRARRVLGEGARVRGVVVAASWA